MQLDRQKLYAFCFGIPSTSAASCLRHQLASRFSAKSTGFAIFTETGTKDAADANDG
jgi:hypothetical protein